MLDEVFRLVQGLVSGVVGGHSELVVVVGVYWVLGVGSGVVVVGCVAERAVGCWAGVMLLLLCCLLRFDGVAVGVELLWYVFDYLGLVGI